MMSTPVFPSSTSIEYSVTYVCNKNLAGDDSILPENTCIRGGISSILHKQVAA